MPQTQTSVEYGNWIEYHPLTTVSDGTPIEFEISGTGEHYIDLASSMLYVQAKIAKPDGTTLDAAGPTILFLHSLFSQVGISLNGTQVSASMNSRPYRAMLETLVSYGDDAKKTQLTSELFYAYKAGKRDTVAFGGDAARNSGLMKRATFTATSNVVDMIGRMHADIFFPCRYLINEVNVKIKLLRSKDAFSLMSANDRKMVVLKSVLFKRKVRLSPSVVLDHAKVLENAAAKYLIRRVACKTMTIHGG